jgi:hypothetical protein
MPGSFAIYSPPRTVDFRGAKPMELIAIVMLFILMKAFILGILLWLEEI